MSERGRGGGGGRLTRTLRCLSGLDFGFLDHPNGNCLHISRIVPNLLLGLDVFISDAGAEEGRGDKLCLGRSAVGLILTADKSRRVR